LPSRCNWFCEVELYSFWRSPGRPAVLRVLARRQRTLSQARL